MADDIKPDIVFSDEDIEKIRAAMGIDDNDIPSEDTPISHPTPPKRKRRPGRPSNADRARERAEALAAAQDTPYEPSSVKETLVPPAPLGKREEKEIASRLTNILTGATGIASMAKPYMQMTEEEAKSISEPLAAYLVRTADTSPYARQILEHYDLMAIVFGVMAYVVRVYNDRRIEVASTNANRQSATLNRISASEVQSDGRRQDEGNGAEIRSPYGTGSVGSIPT